MIKNEVKVIKSKKNGKEYVVVKLIICDGVEKDIFLEPAEAALVRQIYKI